MKITRLLLLIAIGFIKASSFGQSVEIEVKRNNANEKTETDSIVLEKKRKAVKCLFYASTGLHNVIVDHYKSAIRILSTTPVDTTYVLYQPESHAPEHYIEVLREELFQSEIWKFMENRVIEQGGKEFYEDIINSYDNAGLMSVIGNLPTKEQWMNRFILPNFRAVYVNNLYWETFGPRIEETDVPIVIEALNEYIKR